MATQDSWKTLLFASHLSNPFKSYNHSDQLSLWPFITPTNCHSDQLPYKILGKLSNRLWNKAAAIFEGRPVVIFWFSRVSCVSWKGVWKSKEFDSFQPCIDWLTRKADWRAKNVSWERNLTRDLYSESQKSQLISHLLTSTDNDWTHEFGTFQPWIDWLSR